MIPESIDKNALFMQYIKKQTINVDGIDVRIGKLENKLGIKYKDKKVFLIPFVNNLNIFLVKYNDELFEIEIKENKCNNNAEIKTVVDDFFSKLISNIIKFVDTIF